MYNQISTKDNTTMKTKIALFGIGLLLLLVSCQNTNTAALEKEWKLVSLNGANYETYSVTLDILADNLTRISGQGFCNGYFAPSTIATAGVFSVDVVASTKKACLDASISEYELEYFHALEQVTDWVISGENLILSAENVKIVYK